MVIINSAVFQGGRGIDHDDNSSWQTIMFCEQFFF